MSEVIPGPEDFRSSIKKYWRFLYLNTTFSMLTLKTLEEGEKQIRIPKIPDGDMLPFAAMQTIWRLMLSKMG
jgi:hypothetical protein